MLYLQNKTKLYILIFVFISFCGCSTRQIQESELLAIFHSITVSPDSKYLAVGRNIFNIVFIYDAKTLKVVKTLTGLQDDISGKMSANSLAFSPDGNFLAAAGIDNEVVVWDVNSGEIILHLPELEGATSIEYSPDGSTLAVAGIDDAIRFVNTEKGEVTYTLLGHYGKVLTIALSPDGNMIASGGVDKSLRLWDFDTKKQIALYEGHKAPIFHITFTPDGRGIASASTNEIKLWQIETANKAKELTGLENDYFGPTDAFVSVTAMLSVMVGRPLIISPRDIPLSVSFSPDQRFLAFTVPEITASGDHILLIHDFKSNKTTQIRKGLYAVAFSPDGKFLAAAGNGVKLVDPLTGEWIIPGKHK